MNEFYRSIFIQDQLNLKGVKYMKQLLILVAIVLFILIVPAIAFSQPLPPHYRPYYVVERCYTVLLPYPHSRCEYVRVRRGYTPVPMPPPHYRPLPPLGPRPGHRPPPHNHKPAPGPHH
jgi:hypothetical protein